MEPDRRACRRGVFEAPVSPVCPLHVVEEPSGDVVRRGRDSGDGCKGFSGFIGDCAPPMEYDRAR